VPGRLAGRHTAAAEHRDIRDGGNREAFAGGGFDALRGWSYRSMWWVTHNAHGASTARGVHGQRLYVDPVAETVIARFASHPTASNAANDPHTIPAFEAVTDHPATHGRLPAGHRRPRPGTSWCGGRSRSRGVGPASGFDGDEVEPATAGLCQGLSGRHDGDRDERAERPEQRRAQLTAPKGTATWMSTVRAVTRGGTVDVAATRVRLRDPPWSTGQTLAAGTRTAW
jgi:hypothetical protein